VKSLKGNGAYSTWIAMKTFNERIADVSFHLQSLTAPEYSSKVQDAVERKDKDSLIRLCKKAKVPGSLIDIIISVLLSVSPQQKWPDIF
jgi:hypothetical protein